MRKDNSKEPATRQDLNATRKELLEKLASKEELQEVKKTTERIALQVVKNTEDIKKMASKEEMDRRFNEVMVGQDKIITILERLDKERIFTTE